ncbi:NlpC/P60 family protein [Streptobacillus moniliformis]|uniref:C40 family peptidase n=1 Tax=Streptobacillus moniliformis TaxID=34105 RepID=UPI000CFF7669|nr:C40 family peptidase [Streptobacillus moniliformis]AVL43644.1 NlpC/P60 family protein [Streptobacillus moniliformis]
MKKIFIFILLTYISFSNGINFVNRNNNFKLKKSLVVKEKIEIKKEKRFEKNKKKILILKKAKELMGKKYLWGAKVGDYNNFDCSSFVKALYKEVGIDLPRVSKNQSKIGEKISLNELEIGDLIFFHTLGDYVSHVGIYIGNNEFIHASSKAKKTIVSKLSGYYREKAVFGTRLGI